MTDGLLFPEEEAPGLLQAEEEAEAHEKSDVTSRVPIRPDPKPV